MLALNIIAILVISLYYISCGKLIQKNPNIFHKWFFLSIVVLAIIECGWECYVFVLHQDKITSTHVHINHLCLVLPLISGIIQVWIYIKKLNQDLAEYKIKSNALRQKMEEYKGEYFKLYCDIKKDYQEGTKDMHDTINNSVNFDIKEKLTVKKTTEDV